MVMRPCEPGLHTVTARPLTRPAWLAVITPETPPEIPDLPPDGLPPPTPDSSPAPPPDIIDPPMPGEHPPVREPGRPRDPAAPDARGHAACR